MRRLKALFLLTFAVVLTATTTTTTAIQPVTACTTQVLSSSSSSVPNTASVRFVNAAVGNGNLLSTVLVNGVHVWEVQFGSATSYYTIQLGGGGSGNASSEYVGGEGVGEKGEQDVSEGGSVGGGLGSAGVRGDNNGNSSSSPPPPPPPALSPPPPPPPPTPTPQPPPPPPPPPHSSSTTSSSSTTGHGGETVNVSVSTGGKSLNVLFTALPGTAHTVVYVAYSVDDGSGSSESGSESESESNSENEGDVRDSARLYVDANDMLDALGPSVQASQKGVANTFSSPSSSFSSSDNNNNNIDNSYGRGFTNQLAPRLPPPHQPSQKGVTPKGVATTNTPSDPTTVTYSYVLSVFTDCTSLTSEGSSLLRFINVVFTETAVALVDNGTVVTTPIPYGFASVYVEVQAGLNPLMFQYYDAYEYTVECKSTAVYTVVGIVGSLGWSMIVVTDEAPPPPPPPPPVPPAVRFLHAMPDMGKVDVVITSMGSDSADDVLFTGVTYSEISEYTDLSYQGQFAFSITNSDSGSLVTTITTGIFADTRTTIVAVGIDGDYESNVFSDAVNVVAKGQAQVAISNLMIRMPYVDGFVDHVSVCDKEIAFNHMCGALAVPAGEKLVTMYPSHTNNSLVSQTIFVDSLFSIYLLGVSGSTAYPPVLVTTTRDSPVVPVRPPPAAPPRHKIPFWAFVLIVSFSSICVITFLIGSVRHYYYMQRLLVGREGYSSI